MGLQQQTTHARAVQRLRPRRRAGMATDDHVRITVPSSSLPPSLDRSARSLAQDNGTERRREGGPGLRRRTTGN